MRWTMFESFANMKSDYLRKIDLIKRSAINKNIIPYIILSVFHSTFYFRCNHHKSHFYLVDNCQPISPILDVKIN